MYTLSILIKKSVSTKDLRFNFQRIDQPCDQLGYSFGSPFADVGQRIANEAHIGCAGVDEVDWCFGADVMHERSGGVDGQRRAYHDEHIGRGGNLAGLVEHRHRLPEEDDVGS